MVVGPVVIGGLVMMLLLVFKTQNGVTNRLSGAVDAQVTTANFQADVQNASYVTTSSTPSCGSSGTQIFGTETDNSTVVVSYDVVLIGTKYHLVRNSCASTNTTTPNAETTVSTDVSKGQTVTVSCATTCSTTGGWVTATNVTAVSLAVTEPTTGVSYSLTSTPRVYSPASGSAGGSPDVPAIHRQRLT